MVDRSAIITLYFCNRSNGTFLAKRRRKRSSLIHIDKQDLQDTERYPVHIFGTRQKSVKTIPVIKGFNAP